MPANRMLHKRAGSGERTNALTNLEFRAWIIYRLAADDFGVLRCDIGSLIEAHPYFATEKPRALKAALERLVNIGLLGRFTSQGLTYVYSRDWQDFERIEWPSMTTKPTVPPDFLDGCTPETQRLFSVWPGQKRVPPASPRPPDKPGSSSLGNSDGVATESLPRAKAHTNANANGSGSSGGVGGICDTPERRLWDAWRDKSLVVANVVEPAEPKYAEGLKLMEACAKVPDEDTRMRALDAFWALDERDRRRLNIPNRKIGYFVMALTELVGVPSEDAELAKFVAGGR